MEVTGTVLRKLELETGVSKAGKEWQKQSIVIFSIAWILSMPDLVMIT